MSPMRLNMVFVGIVTVLTGGFTAGVLMPGLRELTKSRNEVTSAADRTRASQVSAGEESAIYQAILDLQRELEESRRHVPAERQFGEFLNDVSEALRSLDVAKYELRPLSERPLSAADGVATGVGTGPAFVLPVRLKVECSFKTTFEFLTRLADMPRLTRIAAIEINGKDSRSPHVEVRMLIETYYCPEIVEAADIGAPEVRP
jgi:Tfp pilus assembly protein PilO